MKYRRVVVTRHGGPEVLQMIEEELPEPQPGEVHVKVLAAGVSAYDLMFRRSGLLPGTPRPPFTLGTDVAGIVDKPGTGVTTLTAGQRVAGATFSRNGMGGYAEFICLPANELAPVPADVDLVEAICVTVNYLTAHMMLHRVAGIRSEECILVHGAAGGVGTALLDLGRLAGLKICGTASAYNHDLVASFGATPIDYRREDFVKRVRTFTGDGVDAVFDPIGGARQLWRSHQALRKGGRLVWFGMAATKKKGLGVLPFTLLMVALLKLIRGSKHILLSPDLGKDNVWYREILAELFDWLAAGKLKPVVAERIPLAEAARAHALLERGGYAGKVVLITNKDGN